MEKLQNNLLEAFHIAVVQYLGEHTNMPENLLDFLFHYPGRGTTYISHVSYVL